MSVALDFFATAAINIQPEGGTAPKLPEGNGRELRFRIRLQNKADVGSPKPKRVR